MLFPVWLISQRNSGGQITWRTRNKGKKLNTDEDNQDNHKGGSKTNTEHQSEVFKHEA